MSKWFLKEEDLKPKDTCNGMWEDFRKEDGDYFIQGKYHNWIVRFLGNENIARIFNGSSCSYFFQGSNNWDRTQNYKITLATKDQTTHLDACIEAGKYVDPPVGPLEGEFNGYWVDFHKEDGDYYVEYRNHNWIVRFLGGEDVYRTFNKKPIPEFHKGGRSWLRKYKIVPATKDQSEHLLSLIHI